MSAIQNYERVKTFTQGSGGLTSLVQHRVTKCAYVLKEMKNPFKHGRYFTPQEVRALVGVLRFPTHPNVARLFMHESTQDVSYLILQYYPGGDLLDYSQTLYFHDKKAPTPPIFMLHFTIQMANALAFLHHNLPSENTTDSYQTHPSLIHGDVKLENIFLEFSTAHPAGLPEIVLGDFGCAMEESYSMGWCGTDGYLAPEVEQYRKAVEAEPNLVGPVKVVTTKADVYSLGVCLWRLGTKVWRTLSTSEQSIPDGKEMTFQINSGGLGVPDMADFVTLMKACLAKDPNDRLETVHLWNEIPQLQAQLDKRIQDGEKLRKLS